jgi:hypothetical protein
LSEPVPTRLTPANRRRLAVVAITLLVLVLGAAVAVHASPDGAPAATDGQTKLMVLPYAFDEYGNQVEVGATVTAGQTVWYANKLVFNVGSSVALSVTYESVWIGQVAGHDACWVFADWSQQAANADTATGGGSSRNISFGGISDVSDGADHFLWLRYYYYIDNSGSGLCHR